MIRSINELKEKTPDKVLYLLIIDDKIIHVSNPVIKILKQDPTGMSIGTFLTAEDKVNLQKRGFVEAGSINRDIKLGQQILNTDFEVTNEEIDNKILSYVLVKQIRVMDAEAA